MVESNDENYSRVLADDYRGEDSIAAGVFLSERITCPAFLLVI